MFDQRKLVFFPGFSEFFFSKQYLLLGPGDRQGENRILSWVDVFFRAGTDETRFDLCGHLHGTRQS